MEEGGWWRGDGGGRGGWRREAGREGTQEEGGTNKGVGVKIKDEIVRMERIQHNTTIGNNVFNEYGIEEF